MPDGVSAKIVPALAMIRSAAEEAGSDPGDPAGMLRLNVPPESSALWYASILLPFLQRYPRIRVDIYSQKERVDIVADGFDAGIRLAEDVPGDMIAVRLTPEMRMIVVAAPASHTRAHRRRQRRSGSIKPCVCAWRTAAFTVGS